MLIVIISFSVGAFVSKCIHLGVKFENTLTLSDIVYVGITSIVTLFAAWYLSKKLNEDRFSKELAIADLKDIEQVVAAIIDKAQDNTSNINGELMKLLNKLQQLLSRFDRTCTINNNDSKYAVRGNFNTLYRYATDFSGEPLDTQAVVKYGTDLIVEIRNTISSINRL